MIWLCLLGLFRHHSVALLVLGGFAGCFSAASSKVQASLGEACPELAYTLVRLKVEPEIWPVSWLVFTDGLFCKLDAGNLFRFRY